MFEWLSVVFAVLARHWGWLAASAHAIITLYLLGRILANQKNTGIAVAWLVLLFAIPILGVVAYLLIGEPYLGKRYQSRNIQARQLTQKLAQQNNVAFEHDTATLSTKYRGISRLSTSITGFGAYDGHETQLLITPDTMFDAIIEDINKARLSILLEFYVIFPKGRVQEVFRAILDARGRGVRCQILADSVGSFGFFSDDWHDKLIAAGVSVHRSLPVGLFKTLFKRTDIRNHRKIVVIDGVVGYTGSFNLVDPKFFKQDKNVGEWIDVFMRITAAKTGGANVVSAMSAVCLTDIGAESQKNLYDFTQRADERINRYTRRLYQPEPAINDVNDTPARVPRLLGQSGGGKFAQKTNTLWQRWTTSIPYFSPNKNKTEVALDTTEQVTATLTGVVLQLIPSAPQLTGHVIYNTLLSILHRANWRIQITTPYFVPDEALLSALTTAAKRGVEVTLIVPKKVDSFWVQHASQASYAELLAAGVHIALFTGGLLHTKTVVIDDDYALFGTVNMDLRSFYLNMELSLAIYSPKAVSHIVSCQTSYLKQCQRLDKRAWDDRSQLYQLFDAGIRLFSPLL